MTGDRALASFIAQHAQLELWSSWGIRPNRLVGIGVGELVTASVAGILTVEQSLSILAGDFTGGSSSRTPSLPLFASATGSWLGDGELPDDAGWAERARSSRRDTTALQSLAARDVLWLELGKWADPAPLSTGPASNVTMTGLLTGLGRLWSEGVDVDWGALHADGARRRIALPTYPFERRRYFWENG